MEQRAGRRDTDLSDGELLNRFATSGDQKAFAELVRRHGTMVLRLCRRMSGGDAGAAEDAAQHVFLTLASRAGVLQSRKSLAGWLYRAAWNVASRERRDRSVRANYERHAATCREREQAVGAGDPDPVPFAVATSEFNDVLQRVIGTLPENYRDAVVLHHFGGHTVEQTAQALDVPTGTAAAWASRGRVMLREQLTRMGYVVTGDAIAAWLAVRVVEAGELTPHGAMARLEGGLCRRVSTVLAETAHAGAALKLAAGATGAAAARGVGAFTFSSLLTAPAMLLGLSPSAAKAATVAIATSAVAVGGTVYVSTPKSSHADAPAHTTLQPQAQRPKSQPLFATESARGNSGALALPEPTSAVALLGFAGVCLARRRRQ